MSLERDQFGRPVVPLGQDDCLTSRICSCCGCSFVLPILVHRELTRACPDCKLPFGYVEPGIPRTAEEISEAHASGELARWRAFFYGESRDSHPHKPGAKP